MPHTRRTLNLDRDTWDITLTGTGQIAVVGGDYASMQDVANEVRLFTKDAYFIQENGIPHFAIELGQRLTPSLLKLYVEKAALRVSDVKEIISIDISSLDFKTRKLSGSIRFKTAAGIEMTSVLTYF